MPLKPVKTNLFLEIRVIKPKPIIINNISNIFLVSLTNLEAALTI